MADSITGTELVNRGVNVPGIGSQRISLTAGYANGSFHASSQESGPTDVLIDVNGSVPGADVLDIENGDATPQQAATWVHGHNAHGGTNYPAILYVNRSNIHVVANVLTAIGLQVDRDYKWWISTLDGTTTVPDMTGVVAVQAWNAGNFAPRNIDLSIVYDDAWKGHVFLSEDDDMSVKLEAKFDSAGKPLKTYEVVPVNGKRGLFLATSYGHTVDITGITAVYDTNSNPQTTLADSEFQLDPDRPGPIGLPANVRHVVVEFVADHNFLGWAD